MAFGEVLFEEHAVSPKMPYLFNGKELDQDTGLYYYGARYYDPKVSLWLNVDPLAEKYPHISPYTYTLNNPIKFIDPDGRSPKDGIIIIKGNQITISSNIYLYGSGATQDVRDIYQKGINNKWGGTFNANTSDGKKSFNVNFNVNVTLYKNKEKNNPFIIPESWNPLNRDNFIEVTNDDSRSFVERGDEGKWRSKGRNGLSLEQDNPAPHELGHLLGLKDRYDDRKGIDKGWENNIMGHSIIGKVDQRNIDGILEDAIKAYEIWSKDNNNKNKEFRYEINIDRVNKENK